MVSRLSTGQAVVSGAVYVSLDYPQIIQLAPGHPGKPFEIAAVPQAETQKGDDEFDGCAVAAREFGWGKQNTG